ncbi:hypothetical protein SAMN02745121_01952 [Nannocystis exedens]|uniref:Uncharacterized protein n=1 Tax=Nannocystis exedens TaxID=54 RepID=A0A1I1VTF8_9BACT|nr:hypothetical protein [Nannocystis exedens]PCC72835.1 hypothetical protein NAEX_05920 [Nannocystis exedens]SFD86327.1 hypothetical protein SAMN02745121_01952 [Nannocystis exedens]
MKTHDFAALHARHVWRGTLIAALLNACLYPLDILRGRDIGPAPWWPVFGASVVGFLIAAFILVIHRRRPQSVLLGSTLFIVNQAAILVSAGLMGPYQLQDPNLIPFQVHKLGTLTVAILAPERWVGLLCIFAFALIPVIQFGRLDPALQGRIDTSEPLVMLVYGAVAAVLLLYRLRGLATERALVQAQTEAADARRTARLLLAVRDLSNTPLQVIALASAAVRRRNPDLGEPLDRLDRALERLRALHQPLKAYEADLEWRPGDESIDAEAVLAAAEVQARARRSSAAV